MRGFVKRPLATFEPLYLAALELITESTMSGDYGIKRCPVKRTINKRRTCQKI